jgi:hypothetical protein
VLAVLDKQEDKYKNSLEDYLLSLWVVIKKYEKHQPSYSLFVSMIEESFDTQPCQFDDQWLTYESDLFWEYQNDSLAIKEYRNGEWMVTAVNVDGFDILAHTIFFQIADLHRMNPAQINDPKSYFGIDSPTGNRWYNFEVFTYWECATAGMEAHLHSSNYSRKKAFDECSWATLAALLKLGQIYE